MVEVDDRAYDAAEDTSPTPGRPFRTPVRRDPEWDRAIMDTTTRPAGNEAGRDPYFQASEVGPAKASAAISPSGEVRVRRWYRRRVRVLVAVLAIVWIGVLVDPHVGPSVLFVLVAFGAVIGLFGAAMGLGLIGFGLCSAGDRVVTWLRRGTRWPEE